MNESFFSAPQLKRDPLGGGEMAVIVRHPYAVLIAALAGACQPSETAEHASTQSVPAAPSSAVATIDSEQVAGLSGKSFDSARASEPNDWLIVPGTRIGPITAGSTESDLKTTFGTDEVARDSVFWFEGEYRPATVLFPQDSVLRLTIVWKDEEGWSHPTRIELEGARSLWHTPDGISLGTTLEELENLNGKPFRITSADHDYGGLAWSWENGALETKLKFIELRLEPRFYSEEHHPYSSDSAARAARASVSLLYAYFPE